MLKVEICNTLFHFKCFSFMQMQPLNCAPCIWGPMFVILGESVLFLCTAGTVSKHAYRVMKMTDLHLRCSNFHAKRDILTHSMEQSPS